jgi:hypothetical protein
MSTVPAAYLIAVIGIAIMVMAACASMAAVIAIVAVVFVVAMACPWATAMVVDSASDRTPVTPTRSQVLNEIALPISIRKDLA